MNRIIFVLLFLFSACATSVQEQESRPIKIVEINPNRRTALTKQNLEHLFKVYDLAPFVFTNTVHLESMVIPHSHPVLTLNTRHMGSPNKLLALFVHEQLHWWAEMKNDEFNKALIDVRKLYPTLPKELAAKARSTYLHLLICSLELMALKHFLGEDQAKELVRQSIEEDKVYPWIYSEVLKREKEFLGIINKYKLAPSPLL